MSVEAFFFAGMFLGSVILNLLFVREVSRASRNEAFQMSRAELAESELRLNEQGVKDSR